METFLQNEIENFEIFDGNEKELFAEKRNTRQRQWVGTWNNPSMSDEEFKEYLNNLCDEEILQYGIFQREKGEKTGTIHFQFFVNYKNPQYFKKVKESYLPYGCHFAPMISTAERCRAYCSKVDTRISGPYEVGEFEYERQRSDLKKAIQMIDEGIPFEVVKEIYSTQCVLYERQLRSREQQNKLSKFSNQCRNVEVTYIYGSAGIGKTSSIYKKYGFDDVFFVSDYEKYMFENYNYKKILVFDEFAGQVKIPQMNRYLDIYPLELRGLGKKYPACYDKVFILSNFSPSKVYANLLPEDEDLKLPFMRRLHNIIYIDENGIEHKEKETIFKELSPDEMELPGLTRKIEKTIYYNRVGKILRVDDGKNVEQINMSDSLLIEMSEYSGDLPW